MYTNKPLKRRFLKSMIEIIALFVYLEQDTSSLMQFLRCFALTAKMYLTQRGVDEKVIILINRTGSEVNGRNFIGSFDFYCSWIGKGYLIQRLC